MGTHRAGPPADEAGGDGLPAAEESFAAEPLAAEPPAPAAPLSGRSARRAARLAKTERAVATYSQKDAARAERRFKRRHAELARRDPDAAAALLAARAALPPGVLPDDGAFADGAFGDGAYGASRSGADRPVAADRYAGPAAGIATAGDGPAGTAGKVKAPKEPRAAKEPRVKQPRPKDPRRRRRQAFLTAFSALGIAAAVGGGLAVANFAEGAGGEDVAPPVVTTLSATALQQLTSVPADTLDQVGAGSAVALLGRVSGPVMRSGGKVRILYIGGEACALCAAERWPLIVALSRFGTWNNLTAMLSPKDDVYPNTPTLTFHGATYTSKYLAFAGFETTSRARVGTGYAVLDAVPAADSAIMRKLRTAPYVPAESTGRLPFVDIGGRYVGAGSHVRPQVFGLWAGSTPDQVAAALADPTQYMAKAIDGAANAWTAAICQVIPQATRPAEVCSSTAAKAGRQILRAASG